MTPPIPRLPSHGSGSRGARDAPEKNMNKIERKKAVRLWKQGVPLHLAGLGITRPVRPAGPSLPYRLPLATGRFAGKTAARDLASLRFQLAIVDARPVPFFCGGAR